MDVPWGQRRLQKIPGLSDTTRSRGWVVVLQSFALLFYRDHFFVLYRTGQVFFAIGVAIGGGRWTSVRPFVEVGSLILAVGRGICGLHRGHDASQYTNGSCNLHLDGEKLLFYSIVGISDIKYNQ